ncbi:peptidoglycan DD-metalloendopeptidase family protein [Azohydromonas caseinilytica]|uniref:Peptidoglycan DD-metalloendopeptidase family protein n=1 Tax=Azohydromonas caseinilytica TaxID=2728836 RepID=A0A848F9K8_9BURK|nr:peptidoglycan DD-metalloendopeptidase family protein [Azohydromonas caseinilytica]NML15415.1 peptidoglycan DD-metalloendopeptidase family protein [Azohydromonas caseinilytica]
MSSNSWRSALAVAAGVSTVLIVGCASPTQQAPVEDRPRTAVRTPTPSTSMPAPVQVVKPLRGIENAGKPGYYTIRPGDTLIRIGLEHGQSWRDIARWSGIDNPNLIEVGEVVRVVPLGVDPMVVASRPVASTRVESRPLDAKPAPVAAASVPSSSSAPSAASTPSSASAPATPVAAAASASDTASAAVPSAPARETAARDPDDSINWIWPAGGNVTAAFDDTRNKGITIGGKAGDPVLAAADGRVVYAGSGLRGYGNLVIVKHNNTYLTAYAHNQTLLVKEDQVVRRGQRIAEMGASDANRVQLHFEIRKQGKPIDPTRLLPPR